VARHRYLIALGSNMRHHRHGAPERVVAAALRALDRRGLTCEAASPIVRSAPLGPSRRRFANAVAIVATRRDPPEMLERMHTLEHKFGRCRGQRRGQPWRARVLDLDIVLWDGGAWHDGALTLPHPAFRARDFVLRPAARIAPDWRDPLSGLTIRQLATRLTRPRPTRTEPVRTARADAA
jgi:2-amino-4-hydroxy-6-hydroxymethyldihydropteridine diphosphokinase